MRRKATSIRVTIMLIVSLSAILSIPALACQTDALESLTCPPPGSPSSFWGYVTFNAAPATAGLKLA